MTALDGAVLGGVLGLALGLAAGAWFYHRDVWRDGGVWNRAWQHGYDAGAQSAGFTMETTAAEVARARWN
jgi:hypothetical protein